MSEALAFKWHTYYRTLLTFLKTSTAQRNQMQRQVYNAVIANLQMPNPVMITNAAHLSLVFLLKAEVGLLGILLEILQK